MLLSTRCVSAGESKGDVSPGGRAAGRLTPAIPRATIGIQDKKGPISVLKLTKKADYGLIALRHLASVPAGTASAKEIADAYRLPLPLLAKVLQKLTKARVLVSLAGTNGGYKLAREARSISALEVVRAIDGPVILTHCFTEHGTCEQSENCTVREPLRRVHEAILELLNRFTITDLAETPAIRLTQLAAVMHPKGDRAHQPHLKQTM
jgi:Rrf2 family protein